MRYDGARNRHIHRVQRRKKFHSSLLPPLPCLLSLAKSLATTLQPMSEQTMAKCQQRHFHFSCEANWDKKYETLTLQDWLVVFAFIDNHLDVPQSDEAVAKSHPSTTTLPACTKPGQLEDIENELLESVTLLQECRRIIGNTPTLDDLIEPPEERVVEDSPYRFERGDEEIVVEVNHQLAVGRGDVIEVETDSKDGETTKPEVSNGELMGLCSRLEGLCLSKVGEVSGALEVVRDLRRFREQLQKIQQNSLEQVTLESLPKS